MPPADADWLKYLLARQLITAEQYQQWILRSPSLDLAQLLMKHAAELSETEWLDQALQLDHNHWIPGSTEVQEEVLRLTAQTAPELLAWGRQHYGIPLQAQPPLYVMGVLRFDPGCPAWKALEKNTRAILLRAVLTPHVFARMYPKFMQQIQLLCS